ncbi:unnamed protein product [Cylindrotheca closterium]|uniref:ATP-dependent transporter ycf16 n=1 Tax=Cylindrotheca closterium TaxID=2856 RepID=A0AAD2FWH4_9STRA|nr:unnamed protein product [Cylindrotheca closterium]
MCENGRSSNQVEEAKTTSKADLSRWPEDPDKTSGCVASPCRFLLRQYQNWTFAYMGAVLQKGARQNKTGGSNLSQSDLYVVPKAMRSSVLVQLFEENYQKFQSIDKDDKRLIKILWNIAIPTYIPAGFCELIVVLCGTGLPLLVRELIRVIEANPRTKIVDEGMPFAISIFLVSVINGLGNNRHRHLALKTGVALRATLVSLIYDHVLQLSPEGKQSLTSGEVTNLVAVDTQKLYEVAQDGHLIWALPLSIVLVSIFLYRTLGPSIFIGIAVLICFVPLIQKITEQMLKARGKRIKFTDERINLVSNMLQGIKVAKLNNYEENYLQRVTTARNRELKYLRTEMAIWATTLAMTVVSPVLATAATFIAYVYIDESHILTASDTFGVLLLFSALRFPINYAGRLIGKLAQALSAVQRISQFLARQKRSNQKQITNGGHVPEDSTRASAPLIVSQASFRVGSTLSDIDGTEEGVVDDTQKEDTGFTVTDFDFSVDKGEVLCVCGPVGSGKSTLLNGILDEAEAIGKSAVVKEGKVSYVPQTPFILNLTLRDNILFGLPLDKERYERVLDACCLRTDLEQLGEAGDLTEIGERGVTLSGGQKQRVSLARAAYAKSDILILDDPFSALDSGTGRIVFERLLLSKDSLFRESAIILVTHGSHFISNKGVDKILVVVDGANRFLGIWEELVTFEPSDDTTKRAVDHIRSTVREDNTEAEGGDEEVKGDELSKETSNSKATGRLMQVEEREHGLSSTKTWLLWFKRAGGAKFLVLQVIFMAIDRTVYVATEWVLARWTSATVNPVVMLGWEFPPQSDGFSAQTEYVKVYAILLVTMVVAVTVRSEWAVTGGARAGKHVFESMLSSVLMAPMSYYESQPTGRLLNRFTYDTEVNDVVLTQAMVTLMISWSWYFAGIAIQFTILPWTAAAIVPVSVMYWVLALHYRLSGPDLQRLDALSRSPLQSMVSECLEGSTSIRVYHQDKNFVDRFQSIVDSNSSALLNFVSAQRWLGIRIELLGSLVVLVSSSLVVSLNDVWQLEAGMIGLLIMWASHFTITLNFLVDTFAEAEAAITAIERVDAMADLPREKPMKTAKEFEVDQEWPRTGSVSFEGVSMRYRKGLPCALNDLSFQIPAGKTCGVVGRTGAGKSSLTVALFRLVEIESGRIMFDGVDLGNLGLSDVRGRGMSIIPQDPFLTGDVLRDCLDPFNTHSDEDIIEALKAVRMGGDTPEENAKILTSHLEEGGANYSVGERQLLNLARAFLSQPKLLVLDEATASIDGETDAFIQNMLRSRFPNTTLITIAHRLNTIMDYDLVLVMDAGRAVEFGSPKELLDNADGIFSELLDATGTESSLYLREMANKAVTDGDMS